MSESHKAEGSNHRRAEDVPVKPTEKSRPTTKQFKDEDLAKPAGTSGTSSRQKTDTVQVKRTEVSKSATSSQTRVDLGNQPGTSGRSNRRTDTVHVYQDKKK